MGNFRAQRDWNWSWTRWLLETSRRNLIRKSAFEMKKARRRRRGRKLFPCRAKRLLQYYLLLRRMCVLFFPSTLLLCYYACWRWMIQLTHTHSFSYTHSHVHRRMQHLVHMPFHESRPDRPVMKTSLTICRPNVKSGRIERNGRRLYVRICQPD